MSRNKQNGTRYERATKKALEGRALVVRRLAEEGAYDAGDLELPTLNLVVECRWRQTMQIHKALGKANAKAAEAGYGGAILVWKRTVPTKSGGPRQPVEGGEREVWAFPKDLALELLEAYRQQKLSR